MGPRPPSGARSPLLGWAAVAAALALLGPGVSPAAAQDGWPGIGFPLAEDDGATRIVVLDQDRLFADSLFGQRVAAEIDAKSRLLAAENRRLEAQLEQEERDLTALRPTLGASAFRDQADAFNERVQRIRTEQDAKARGLSAFRDAEQQRFLAAMRPILAELAEERGAVAILERRMLLLALESIDITARAVERVDELIGDGAVAAGQEPDGGTAEPTSDDLTPAPDAAPALPEGQTGPGAATGGDSGAPGSTAPGK